MSPKTHFPPRPGDSVHLHGPGWWLGSCVLGPMHAESGLPAPGAAGRPRPTSQCELPRLSAEHKTSCGWSQAHVAPCLICPSINSFQVTVAHGNICVPSLLPTDVDFLETASQEHFKESVSIPRPPPPPQPPVFWRDSDSVCTHTCSRACLGCPQATSGISLPTTWSP